MKQKNYLLINPPRYEVAPEYLSDGFFELISKAFFLPVALLRIATYLRSKGDAVALINCCPSKPDSVVPHYRIGQRQCGSFMRDAVVSPLYHFGISFENFREKLMFQKRPDEIFITSFFTYQWEAVHQIIKICKDVFPSARVTLGGVYPTLCPDHAKTSLADFIHVGELPITNHCRLALDLLEDVPDYIILKTSRGCPGQCSYCAVSLLEGATMRYRSPEDVVDEIEEVVNNFNIRKIVFWESNILLNAQTHFECLLDLIIERKLNLYLEFPEGFNPVLLTDKLLYKMKWAGVSYLSLSLETNNRQMATKRFQSVDKLSSFKRCAASLKSLKVNVMAFVLAGLPGQDSQDVRSAVVDVLHAGVRPLIMPFTPIPGTREYERCYKLIASKGLEELHPLLWPCVESRDQYDFLCKLHGQCWDVIKSWRD